MEAASQQAPDRVPQPESTESQNMSSREGEKPSESNNLTDQPLSAKGERMASSNQSAPTIGLPRDVTNQSGSLAAGLGHSVVHSPSAYTPQAQTFYYGGFGNTAGEWSEYRPFVAAENLDFGSPGIYNDNPSLLFHGGYGYSPQMPYGPYSPVTTPLPSVRGDGHLYSPQQFPLSGPPYYQQSVSPSMPYISSPAPVSQAELSVPIAIDQQGESMLFGPRPGYPSQFGSFGRGGSFTGNSDNASFYDLRQGFDGFGPWSDWSKSPDGHRSLTPLSSPAASPQPINMLGSFGRTVGMGSQQQRPLYGIGSGGSSYTGGYAQNGIPQSSSFGGASFASFGANDRWLTIDKARRRGRESGASCSCNGTVDILSEQNRGPRASKPRPQAATEHGSSIDANKTCTKTYSEPYNQPDFVTEYNDAKFFVIKSYSEDNVHKSIKYGVWASTPNGNRKLDSAYRGVKEKQGTCPVFLFFSVNASAQFCGVAEMVGAVDFDKSVDYWQQDKWSGQFPVKWHIIKDVPNSQFRHIILENNDNKPVTNSRDTQEVKLEQGIEMLNIFKNYETDLSILDDFDFYEERQKMMQDRKARQQASLAAAPIVGGGEQQNSVLSSSNYIKQLSKSFKQVIKLEESNKEELMTEKSGAGAPSSTSTAGTGPKAEDNRKTVVMVSNMQGS